MADEQELAQLELLCKKLYEPDSADERTKAEASLVVFSSSPDCLQKCQLLLERQDSSYAQLLAATTLTKLVSRNPCTLSMQQRLDIWNYILNYLASRPKLEPFVVQALVQLYARITKVGWFDYDKDGLTFRNVIPQIRPFLQGSNSVEYAIIGIQLLSQLTCEMNNVNGMEGSRSMAKMRKTASSFKDCILFEIFQLSHELLIQAMGTWKNSSFQDKQQHQLMSQLLKLTLNCLSFDFIGCSPDESSDDLGTVQVPTNWRPVFMDINTLQMFFDLYRILPTNLASIALSCLVQIASVRRSLFSNAERATFLLQLVQGVRSILENPGSLSDPSCYHEFCRLLARLKSNYQLSELVKMESYSQVIQLITKFTVTSLQMWQFAPNSIHYLLSLWQRLVASVPYVKASEPHMLDTYTPEVTRAYVTSRLEAVNVIVKENLEDPLDDLGQVQQQLDQMSTITRCEYEKTCTLLANLFDQTAQAYQDRLQSMNGGMGQVANGLGMEIAIQEGQLTWLVYLIGAAIGGRVFLNSQDDHDAMDGELACRVLQLMQLTDSRLANGGHCEKLELALLSFFEQFRKIYIGDQVQRSSKVFRRLSEVLGVCNECTLLAVFVRKIITNLKYWSACELIITKTLQILNDLSLGYSSVRKLVKLEEVQFILANHTAEHFPFLGNQSPLQDMRCRSTFYTSLGRLLMIDLGEDEEKFEQFMRPICAQFDTLSKLLLNDDLNNYPAATREEAKKALIGITRDLRGIAFAFNTKGSFMMLFECLYPLYTPVLHRAIDFWYHDPAVTTPVLKLMAELVQNRSQRLQFDVSSPNGNLLFRETSKMIVNYGSRLLSMGEVPKEQLYALKYKGVSICFAMLKSALCGGYVNFGVFRLYGDRALDDALEIFIKVLLSIPQADLLSFPKLSQTYYVLLESLAQDHMSFLAGLESHVFMFILSSISEGLSALDSMVCTGCCSTLDHIVSYLYKWLTKAYKKVAAVSGQSLETHLMGPVGSGNVSSLMFSVGQLSGLSVDAENCIKILKMHPEILQQMLSTILNIMMFEECKNQWSMSRPLLGLILLNEEYFTRLRQNIIQSQTPEKQGSMAQWFDTLMEGIERNLLTKNRDRFTQNLSVFRRDINDSLKMPMINSNNTCVSLGGDMMS